MVMRDVLGCSLKFRHTKGRLPCDQHLAGPPLGLHVNVVTCRNTFTMFHIRPLQLCIPMT
jgi:hypothetical protein